MENEARDNEGGGGKNGDMNENGTALELETKGGEEPVPEPEDIKGWGIGPRM